MGLAEIVYPHTWYNIREGKNSVEIYAPDNLYLVFKTAEFSIQPSLRVDPHHSIKRGEGVFRKQNDFQMRNKAGIPSQENGLIYKLKLRHGPCI